jgi:hypothetical protein
MVRWDATEHGSQKPVVGLVTLPDAFFTLLSVSVSRKKNAHSPEVMEVQGLA